MRELLREPSFLEAEFEQVLHQQIAGLGSKKAEPLALAQKAMYHRLNVRYPKGDVRYTATLDEQMEDTKNVALAGVKSYYQEFFAPAEGKIVISGQFGPEELKKELTELLGD